MVTAELLSYIKGQIFQGQTSEIIKTTLLNQGWNEIDISQAFIQVTTESSNQTSSSPIATQDKVIVQTASEKEPKFRYVIYFFVGLILSLLGLLIGGIWIMVREKQNKMRKFIVLLLGIIVSIIFWFVMSGGIQLNGNTSNIVLPNNPEAREIQLDLTSLFPDFTYEVTYGEHNPPLVFGNTTISTYITVTIFSKRTIIPTEVTEVGKHVCSTLAKLQKNVSQVQVETVQTKYMIFSSSKGIGGTCEEWNSSEI